MNAMPGRSALGRGDLTASLVLIAPLFLAYQIGVLFAGNVNGADVVTRAVYGGLGRTNYLLASAALAMLFLLWLRRANRWSMLRLETALPVILEAAIYALTLGALITLVLQRLLGLGLGVGSIVDAAGAGVHEELVFRLGLFGGLLALMARLQVDRRVGVAFALVVSAIAFSWAHHIGAHGEPFTWHAFAYRGLAGVIFGLVFYFRSLAHAVYAHAFYDVLVYWRT
jgi:hypothetical protein